ncbi:MAG: hypothetical protein AB7Y46_20115, partial [Armatimonadota bacterium]
MLRRNTATHRPHALAWLAALSTLLAIAWGCGGLPPDSGEGSESAVVVMVFEAETNAQLQVPAVVIVGGVRGVLNVGDGQVVLRDVPPPVDQVATHHRGGAAVAVEHHRAQAARDGVVTDQPARAA